MVRQWPLPEGTFTISSRFEGRTNPVTGAAEHHSGTDLAAADGTPFFACAGGTIKYLGSASGYGHWVVIDHPDSEGGGCSEYGHMWSDLPGLSVGDWVDAGQLIGHVGANGQATGPHLHLTVWQREYGGTRVDPETWLSGCPYPPVGGGPATGPAPEGGSVSTLFGIDVSEFQAGLNLAGSGMDFVIIRLAYGDSHPDDCAVSHTEDWATTGKPLSFYHYLTPWDDLGAQADLVKSQWDACGRRGGVWIDVEEPGITRAQVVGFRDALRARGVLVIGSYSRANFWENLPGGEPSAEEGGGAIWVSHYGDQPTGPIQQAYPGDGGSPWSYPLGDRLPDIWQFTDRVTVPGWSAGVDGNAFRGSEASLRALFTGGTAATSEEDDMFTDDDRAALLDCRAMLQTLCAQDMGDANIAGPYGGWPQTGGRTRTDTLAAIAAKLGVPGTTDTKEK
jgi:GH25 family lysozyme M1 (1,4-beta-N-acetylmuramidase)